MLLVLLSPHALLCALLAGLLLRAQLFERTLVFFILASFLVGNIIVKPVDLFFLFDKVLLQISLLDASLLACQPGSFSCGCRVRAG